jgi:hypothetical protein
LLQVELALEDCSEASNFQLADNHSNRPRN